MTIGVKIRDEKLRYDINREATKISALLSVKTDEHDCLTGKEILLPVQRRVIEQADFIHSPLEKALEKLAKATKDQGKKQIKTMKDHGEKEINTLENCVRRNFWDTDKKLITSSFLNDFLNEEPTYKLNKIVEISLMEVSSMVYFIKQVKRNRVKHIMFKSLEQWDLLENKLIKMIYL